MFKVDGLLFDLDGTLVDSVADIANAANLTLSALGFSEANTEDLRLWVGNGASTLMKRALTGEFDGEPDPELLDKAMPIFFDLYEQNVFVESVFYPGVLDTLTSFRQAGYAIACVTNKPLRHTHALLKTADVTHLFDCVVGSDSTEEIKPHPRPLFYACEQMSLATENCLMVGDSINDIIAAKAANMPCVGLTYGYNQGADLGIADILIDDFADLTNLVCKSTDG